MNNEPKERLLVKGFMEAITNKNLISMIADIVVISNTTKTISQNKREIIEKGFIEKWTEIWTKERQDKIYENCSLLQTLKEKHNYLKVERIKILNELSSEIIDKELGDDYTNQMDVEILKEIEKKLEVSLEPLEKLIKIQGKKSTPKIESSVTLTLLDIFESQSKYESIMNLLIEKKYCAAGTYIWQRGKGELVDLLKYLHKQGYYKENKKPTNEHIKLIAKMTFRTEIEIPTIKAAKPPQNQVVFSFIPLASSIIL